MELDQSTQTIAEGQAEATPAATGINATEPNGAGGQAGGQGNAVSEQSLAGTPETDTFFDPSKLAPELKPMHREMQAAWTRKTQGLAQQRHKIEAYDAFSRDPIGTMQQVAQQYGYTLTRGQAADMVRGQAQQQDQQQWEPKTWDDVLGRAKDMAKQEIMAELAPMFNNVQKIQAKSIEAQLNEIDPQWKLYEDEMRATLQQHPTLVNNVEQLYRLSVPEDRYSARAVQAAIKKLQSKTEQASVASKSSTSRTAQPQRIAKSFDEAVAIAKQQLAEQGR